MIPSKIPAVQTTCNIVSNSVPDTDSTRIFRVEGLEGWRRLETLCLDHNQFPHHNIHRIAAGRCALCWKDYARDYKQLVN